MPGLDQSDLIAFMRVIDAPPSDIAVRAAGFIETVQKKIKGYEAHIAAAPEDRLLYESPTKRCEELLVRLNSVLAISARRVPSRHRGVGWPRILAGVL